MTLHPLSREKWFHPEAYAENRVSKQPYWRAWLNDHATAAWFGFAAGVVCVAVPCAVTLAWVLA